MNSMRYGVPICPATMKPCEGPKPGCLIDYRKPLDPSVMICVKQHPSRKTMRVNPFCLCTSCETGEWRKNFIVASTNEHARSMFESMKEDRMVNECAIYDGASLLEFHTKDQPHAMKLGNGSAE